MSSRDGLIRLSLKPDHEHEIFLGRENELDDLRSFLKNSDGGTILLGGLRGSGKTNFLEKLKSETEQKEKIIYVEVVLHNDIQEDELRYVLLRAICYALVPIERRLAWWRLNGISVTRVYIPLSFKRVGKLTTRTNRRKEFSRLIKLLSYTKMTEKFGRELQADLGSGKNKLGGKATSALDGEVDLSNSRLEHMLRSYLEAVSRLGVKIVFIVDELDKFEEEKSAIDASLIAGKFKNLLTRNGTFAIFVTSEAEIQKVRQKIQDKPYSKEHTLFSKILSLNQLTPLEFANVVHGFFTSRASSTKHFMEVSNYILWETKLHLFTLRQFIDRHKVIDSGKPLFEINMRDTPIAASLQYLLTSIYREESSSKDSDHFNRLLYLSLRKILESLDEGEVIHFRNSSYLTTLASPDDFTKQEDYSKFLHNDSLMPRVFKQSFSSDDWQFELGMLNRNELSRINSALRYLLWALDMCDVLSSNHDVDLIACVIEPRLLRYNRIIDFDISSRKTSSEKKLYAKAAKIARTLENIGEKPEEYLIQNGVDLGVIESVRMIKQETRSFSWSINESMRVLEGIHRKIYDEVFEKLSSSVLQDAKAKETKAYNNPLTIILNEHGIKYRAAATSSDHLIFIIQDVNKEVQSQIISRQTDEIIANVSLVSRGRARKMSNWHNFALGDDFSDYENQMRLLSKLLRKNV